MKRSLCLFLGIALKLGACSEAVDGRESLPADAAPVTQRADAQPLERTDAGPPLTVTPSSCPDGQFATGFNASGELACESIAQAASAAVNSKCTLYSGWRDSCDGCTSDPLKWGQVQNESCSNGAGAGNTCTVETLGAASVNLFGLDTDGDVNGDDKFYMGFRCERVDDEVTSSGPQCPEGSFLVGVRGSETDCTTAEGVISVYAHDSCRLYYGWRDSCDGCTTAPSKVGRVRSVGCTDGGGADNTCINTTIAGGLLDLFGVNTDGDVNGDDKFYVGFQCEGALAQSVTADGTCAPGQLITAIMADGSVECTSPDLAAQTAIQNSCFIYYGWRDNCDGCSTIPSKWGRVSNNSCNNGVGADNTCNTHDFGGVVVTMFGLNTDGDVNGDDKFYAGMQCE